MEGDESAGMVRSAACRCKPQTMQLWGLWVYVVASTYMKRVSDRHRQRTRRLVGDYRLRWKIETLFQALKGVDLI